MTNWRAAIEITRRATKAYNLVTKSERGLAKKVADVATLCHTILCANAASCSISIKYMKFRYHFKTLTHEKTYHFITLQLLNSQ